MFKKCLKPSSLSLYFFLLLLSACLENYFICFLKKANKSPSEKVKTAL